MPTTTSYQTTRAFAPFRALPIRAALPAVSMTGLRSRLGTKAGTGLW